MEVSAAFNTNISEQSFMVEGFEGAGRKKKKRLEKKMKRKKGEGNNVKEWLE